MQFKSLNRKKLLTIGKKDLNILSLVVFQISARPSSQKLPKIDYDFSKILILNKISRYEFEKRKNPSLNDRELKDKLLKRGSNFERLVEAHNTHYRSLEKILNTLKSHRIDFKTTQRFNYNLNDIEWANCIMTTGGDGTFLLASAKVNSNTKPVIGVNTDVTSSEGHLLLSKEQSINFSKTFQKLLHGHFRWLMRTRIRIYLEGLNINLQPIELHDQVLNNLEHRYIEHVEENRITKIASNSLKNDSNDGETQTHRLSSFALNEVFIGESLSARVSYYQMSVDNGPFFRQKSSGIIVCTGTGSTSWCYNINKMSAQSMKKILTILKAKIDDKGLIPSNNEKFVSELTNEFNDSIVFNPDQLSMAYTIRDPIINRVFNNETNRGFANRLVVQSRCFDACLVIDGGQSYQFNDGAKAILECLPSDSLRTVVVSDGQE